MGKSAEPARVYVQPSLVLGLVTYFIVIYPAVHFRLIAIFCMSSMCDSLEKLMKED